METEVRWEWGGHIPSAGRRAAWPGGLATGQRRAEEPAFLFPCHQAGGEPVGCSHLGDTGGPCHCGRGAGQDEWGQQTLCQWPEALVGRPDVAARAGGTRGEQDGTGRASLPESSGKFGKS